MPHTAASFMNRLFTGELMKGPHRITLSRAVGDKTELLGFCEKLKTIAQY